MPNLSQIHKLPCGKIKRRKACTGEENLEAIYFLDFWSFLLPSCKATIAQTEMIKLMGVGY